VQGQGLRVTWAKASAALRPTLSSEERLLALAGMGLRVVERCLAAALTEGVHIPSAAREREERLWQHLHRRIQLSDYAVVRWLRDQVRSPHEWLSHRPRKVVLREVGRALDDGAKVTLLSAYLDHFHTVASIARLAAERGVPMLLDGPMFNLPDVAAT
jgi:hypothetical protein